MRKRVNFAASRYRKPHRFVDTVVTLVLAFVLLISFHPLEFVKDAMIAGIWLFLVRYVLRQFNAR